MEDLQVGQTVELADGRLAVVRYVGQPHFAAGEWVGVELADDSGKNDGSVQGERYFDCAMGRGMFLRPSAVAVIERPASVPVSPKKNGTAIRTTRPVSAALPASGRRTSVVPDAATAKRMSLNAASPSPAVRTSRPTSRPSSLLRVGTAPC
jgi:dynactin 1